MKKHMNRVHNGMDVEIIYLGDKNIKCDNCDFKTGSKGDLRKHLLEVHDGKQNLHCDICNISFKQKSALTDHKKKKRHAIKASNLLLSVDRKPKSSNRKLVGNRKCYEIDQAAENNETPEPSASFKEKSESDEEVSQEYNLRLDVINQRFAIRSCFMIIVVLFVVLRFLLCRAPRLRINKLY